MWYVEIFIIVINTVFWGIEILIYCFAARILSKCVNLKSRIFAPKKTKMWSNKNAIFALTENIHYYLTTCIVKLWIFRIFILSEHKRLKLRYSQKFHVKVISVKNFIIVSILIRHWFHRLHRPWTQQHLTDRLSATSSNINYGTSWTAFQRGMIMNGKTYIFSP